ncbi:hypothetical protein ACJW30_12G070300 [Castanea mollissima]
MLKRWRKTRGQGVQFVIKPKINADKCLNSIHALAVVESQKQLGSGLGFTQKNHLQRTTAISLLSYSAESKSKSNFVFPQSTNSLLKLLFFKISLDSFINLMYVFLTLNNGCLSIAVLSL